MSEQVEFTLPNGTQVRTNNEKMIQGIMSCLTGPMLGQADRTEESLINPQNTILGEVLVGKGADASLDTDLPLAAVQELVNGMDPAVLFAYTMNHRPNALQQFYGNNASTGSSFDSKPMELPLEADSIYEQVVSDMTLLDRISRADSAVADDDVVSSPALGQEYAKPSSSIERGRQSWIKKKLTRTTILAVTTGLSFAGAASFGEHRITEPCSQDAETRPGYCVPIYGAKGAINVAKGLAGFMVDIATGGK